MRPEYGPFASLKSSELWASALKVFPFGVTVVLSGFRIRGPYQGTIGFTLEVGAWTRARSVSRRSPSLPTARTSG